jgi:hypothetical protein
MSHRSSASKLLDHLREPKHLRRLRESRGDAFRVAVDPIRCRLHSLAFSTGMASRLQQLRDTYGLQYVHRRQPKWDQSPTVESHSGAALVLYQPILVLHRRRCAAHAVHTDFAERGNRARLSRGISGGNRRSECACSQHQDPTRHLLPLTTAETTSGRRASSAYSRLVQARHLTRRFGRSIGKGRDPWRNLVVRRWRMSACGGSCNAP